MKHKFYFEGVNSLRFFAAFLVIIFHINQTQIRYGLPYITDSLALFERGGDGVTFFFTLSGFLITYLLLDEHQRNNNVSIKKFYLRRVFRIWPLYFLVVIVGLLAYNYFLPIIGLKEKGEYSIFTAITLYVLFLPNLMAKLYHVGGILHITWSIGVEEQFYLFWAPLMKYFRKRVKSIIALTFLIFTTLSYLNHHNYFNIPIAYADFIETLQFQNMAVGAFWSYLIFTNKEGIINLALFRSKIIQYILLFILVVFFCVGFRGIDTFIVRSIMPFIYGWLIVNVSINKKSVIKPRHRIFEWLGKISYGLYMYHMIIIYPIMVFFMKTSFLKGASLIQYNFSIVMFYLLTFLFTILISHYSHYYFEVYFLKKKIKYNY